MLTYLILTAVGVALAPHLISGLLVFVLMLVWRRGNYGAGRALAAALGMSVCVPAVNWLFGAAGFLFWPLALIGPLAFIALALLWGRLTLPLSLQHSDGSVMLVLAHWAQSVVTLQHIDTEAMQMLAWPYLLHLVLGMTIFLLFPFSRLVHIWSAPVWYLGRRGYQVVRTRRSLPLAAKVLTQVGERSKSA